MIGISTCCLMDEPLGEALDRLSEHTGHIEVMDEGLHYAENPELFLRVFPHGSLSMPRSMA